MILKIPIKTDNLQSIILHEIGIDSRNKKITEETLQITEDQLHHYGYVTEEGINDNSELNGALNYKPDAIFVRKCDANTVIALANVIHINNSGGIVISTLKGWNQ